VTDACVGAQRWGLTFLRSTLERADRPSRSPLARGTLAHFW
jgi:hypothetical protein